MCVCVCVRIEVSKKMRRVDDEFGYIRKGM